MIGVDEIFSRFVTAHRKAGDADPRPYLDELSGVDRLELMVRIDRFLETAPPPAFDAAAFARFRADPARQRLVADVLNASTLAELRAGTNKRKLATALAERLGLSGHEDTVRARYHDIEAGNVDPARVRVSVWEALSDALGTTVDRVRDAAEAAFPGGASAPAAGFSFARHAYGPPASLGAPVADAPDEKSARIVDEAFFED